MVLLTLEFRNNLVGLLGHLLVDILTLLIVFVDQIRFCQRLVEVAFYQQVNGFGTVLHTSGGVDTWSDLEHDIAHRDLTASQSADLNDGFQSYRRVGVKLFQSVEGQDAVLAHDGYDICGNADCAEIE